MTNYPYGDGSSEPLYLTNACCETTHDYAEDLLKKFGIPYSDAEDEFFYPLTKDEEKFIGHELADVADGFGALMGYSALYQGQKYLMPSIELYFGDDGAVTKEDALEYGQALTAEFKDRLADIGGHVFFEEEHDSDRHLIQVLVPFEYAMTKAQSFEEWKAHLEETLLASDLTVTTKAASSPSA